jgi:hypothetical protein
MLVVITSFIMFGVVTIITVTYIYLMKYVCCNKTELDDRKLIRRRTRTGLRRRSATL